MRSEVEGNISKLIQRQDLEALGMLYTRERSSLAELNGDFPSFQGRNFQQWLEVLDAYGLRILEVGGGKDQIAAREILSKLKGVRAYVGYDIKPINPTAEEELEQYGVFEFIKGGMTDFDRKTPVGDFNIVFAHNVAEHLAHPFLLLQEMHDRITRGGILCINGIQVYSEVGRDLVDTWEKEGYQFSYSTARADVKSGIDRLSVTIKRTAKRLIIPPAVGERMVTFSGRVLPTIMYKREQIA